MQFMKIALYFCGWLAGDMGRCRSWKRRIIFKFNCETILFLYVLWSYHHMMTSSNGNIVRIIGHLCREFTGHRRILRTKPVKRSFDIFFYAVNLCVSRWNGRDTMDVIIISYQVWADKHMKRCKAVEITIFLNLIIFFKYIFVIDKT